MTEAQRAQEAEPPERDEQDEATPVVPYVVEVGDRAWTVVDLPDGRSWDVFRSGGADGGTGDRIAHITVSDSGYFSTDAAGTVRGPYVTLDEAVYPIGLDDPTLLGMDVVRRAQDPPPSATPSARRSPTPLEPAVARLRTPMLLAVALVGVGIGLAVQRRRAPR